MFIENKERVAGRWQGNIFYKYTDWIHPIIIMKNALNVRNLVSKLSVQKISRKNNDDDSNWVYATTQQVPLNAALLLYINQPMRKSMIVWRVEWVT